jgi:predicted XRE-type DNA-binding protein
MNEGYESGSGNVYRDLGYDDAEEALQRADLMLDIVAEIHRQGLDRDATLARLGITEERYFELLGGRIKHFAEDELRGYLMHLEEARPTEPGKSTWLHLTSRLVGELRDWLANGAQSGTPFVPAAAAGYRGAGSSTVSSEATSAREATLTAPKAVVELSGVEGLADPRFRWLPVLVRQGPDGLELVLQRRDADAPGDDGLPQVSVFVSGEPLAVRSTDYLPREHRLELLLAGELPAPEYRLAVSPSDQGEVVLEIDVA